VSARLDACRRSSRLYFSHFATRTVDDTVDLYAAKPDIRPGSRFLPTPPAFDAPVSAVHVGISKSQLFCLVLQKQPLDLTVFHTGYLKNVLENSVTSFLC